MAGWTETEPGPRIQSSGKAHRTLRTRCRPAAHDLVDDRAGGDEPPHQVPALCRAGYRALGADRRLYLTVGDGGFNQLSLYCQPIHAQDLPTAAEVAARVLSKVRQIGFGISCSIGISVMSGQQADLSRAVSDADEAMYEAKHRGKNRAVVFGRGPKVDGTAWGAGPADQKKA